MTHPPFLHWTMLTFGMAVQSWPAPSFLLVVPSRLTHPPHISASFLVSTQSHPPRPEICGHAEYEGRQLKGLRFLCGNPLGPPGAVAAIRSELREESSIRESTLTAEAAS